MSGETEDGSNSGLPHIPERIWQGMCGGLFYFAGKTSLCEMLLDSRAWRAKRTCLRCSFKGPSSLCRTGQVSWGIDRTK